MLEYHRNHYRKNRERILARGATRREAAVRRQQRNHRRSSRH
jgi:hypothetical protein